MLPLRIKNHTRILAEGQDEYHCLAVRDDALEVEGHGIVNGMTSAWEPTPAELAVLNAGGSVRLTILGSTHPPVMMGVHAAPELIDKG